MFKNPVILERQGQSSAIVREGGGGRSIGTLNKQHLAASDECGRPYRTASLRITGRWFAPGPYGIRRESRKWSVYE